MQRRVKAKKDAELIKDVGRLVQETAKPLGLKETNKSLNGLVKQRSKHGDKLLKAGAVLLMIPDPVTGAVAIPVLAAGTMLKKRQSSVLKDVFDEANEAIRQISSASSSL